MREMDSVKLYAELSTSDSKFRRTITIVMMRVIDLEVFLRQRENQREGISEIYTPMRYSPWSSQKGRKRQA